MPTAISLGVDIHDVRYVSFVRTEEFSVPLSSQKDPLSISYSFTHNLPYLPLIH